MFLLYFIYFWELSGLPAAFPSHVSILIFHLFSLCMCLYVECVPVCRPQLTVGIFLEYSPGDPSPSPHTGPQVATRLAHLPPSQGDSGNPDFRPHDCTANASAISCQPRSLLEALFLASFLGSLRFLRLSSHWQYFIVLSHALITLCPLILLIVHVEFESIIHIIMFLDYVSLASELFFPTTVSCCNPPGHMTGRRELSLGICMISGKQADEPWTEFPGN